MKEQLKASVLAKCQDLAPMKHDISQFWDESGYVRKTMLSNHEMAWELCQKVWNEDGNSGKIVTSISLFESLPATHINWSIAADILGIKPKEERPSDALLRECWKEASVCIIEGEFEAWLATLPAAVDPLDEHRVILQKAWEKNTIKFVGDYGNEKQNMESFFKLIKIGK